jgi:hypothetical protein
MLNGSVKRDHQTAPVLDERVAFDIRELPVDEIRAMADRFARALLGALKRERLSAIDCPVRLRTCSYAHFPPSVASAGSQKLSA